jgi:molecular chaperone DnaK
MGRIIGIDLGTTNSAMAIVKNGKPEILVNANGSRTTPSVVALYNNQIEVGEEAKELMKSGSKEYADGLVHSVKRKMGTEERYNLGGKEYTPQQISAIILKKLKADAEKILGEPVTEAVISVPAYFNDAERQATKDAGAIAGLKVEKIINEPTAAALAYGLEHSAQEQKVLVYDLGGGTFDVTVLHLYEGIAEVKASTGDKHLGGDDFDNELIRYIVHRFKTETGQDLRLKESDDLVEMLGHARYNLLKYELENAKKKLSFSNRSQVFVSMTSDNKMEHYILDLEVTRTEFEELIKDYIKRTGVYIDQALEAAKWTKDEIDVVLLVGGSTRIPLVEKFLEGKFGKKIRRDINPDEAVALGAAIDAALNEGTLDENESLIAMDITPYTWGTVCVTKYKGILRDGVFARIINAQTKIPCTGRGTFYTLHDNQTEIDVSIYIGESDFVYENTKIKEFYVTGIPPAPAGKEGINLEYTIDVNGTLTATATILSTGQQHQVMVKSSEIRLSEEEVQTFQKGLNTLWQESECTKQAWVLKELINKKMQQYDDPAIRQRLGEYLKRVQDAEQVQDLDELRTIDEEVTNYIFQIDLGF